MCLCVPPCPTVPMSSLRCSILLHHNFPPETQCPHGNEELLSTDRSSSRGSLPQDASGGGMRIPPCPAGRERRKRRKAGGEGGRWFCPTPPSRAGEEEGGQRPGAARAPPEGGGEGGGGGGRTDGRTDGRTERSAAPGAQRLARAALSPAGELRAEGGGGRCSEPGFVLTEPVSCERGAETGTGQGTAGAGLGYEVGAQGYDVGEAVVQSRGAAV